MTLRLPAILGLSYFIAQALLAPAYSAQESAHKPPEAFEEIVVVSYNLENYIAMERREPGTRAAHSPVKPKPESEIKAAVRILSEIKPDVLGLCEIGERKEVNDLRTRLRNTGLDYEFVEFVDGPEPRKLALLSRFPFASRQSAPDVSYDLNGQPQKVRRGFLDVTLQINPKYQLRMIGAHLKSKRAVPEGEALVRRHEAHLLRERINSILDKDPKINLLVYGDLNDTKNEPALHEIMGPRGGAKSLYDLSLRDSVGDRWTHYWKYADIYSRLDYFLVSPGLRPQAIEGKSYIYRSPYWNQASDHRPIVAIIRPVDAK